MSNTFMIASTGSGCGKTTFVTGLLYALKNEMNLSDRSIHAFKCGPDYIDPMFHKEVLSIDSTNLDPFFCDKELLNYVFNKNAADINVIEAAMGLYDGIGTTSRASAYDVAKSLNCPVVLLIDGQGMGYSIVPMIKGYLSYDKEKLIKGIVINRISESYFGKISPVIEEETGIKVLGFIPKVKGADLPGRYLGLMAPHEIDFDSKIRLIANQILSSVKINHLLDISGNNAEVLNDTKEENDNRVCENCYEDKNCNLSNVELKPFKVAVARDEAFSFFYKENLEYLESIGGDLVFFSPLHDEKIPENSDVIVLYGGYPENYAKELSENESMLVSIREAHNSGKKIIAECGGFMYLLSSMESKGTTYKMADIIKGHSFRTKSLVRFGYVNVEATDYRIKAHEFHHYDVANVDYSDNCLVRSESSGDIYKGMIRRDNILAGFPHLYYLSCKAFIYEFLRGSYE